MVAVAAVEVPLTMGAMEGLAAAVALEEVIISMAVRQVLEALEEVMPVFFTILDLLVEGEVLDSEEPSSSMHLVAYRDC